MLIKRKLIAIVPRGTIPGATTALEMFTLEPAVQHSDLDYNNVIISNLTAIVPRGTIFSDGHVDNSTSPTVTVLYIVID